MHALVAPSVPTISTGRIDHKCPIYFSTGRIETNLAALHGKRSMNDVHGCTERKFNSRIRRINSISEFLGARSRRKSQRGQHEEAKNAKKRNEFPKGISIANHGLWAR